MYKSSINKYYFNYLDLARIIGISCVIYGHCHPFINNIDITFRSFIYTFHMPLFFIISGMLNNGKPIRIRNLFYSLLLPYFLYQSLYFYRFIISPKDYIISLLTVDMTPNSPCWFFVALFVVKLICNFVQKKKFLFCLILIIYLIIESSPYILGSFMCSHGILSGLIFYLLGMFYKHFIYYTNAYLINAVALIIVPIYLYIYGKCDMYIGTIGNPIAYLTTSLVSSLSIICICRFVCERFNLKRFNNIKTLSRGTMLIVGTHYLFINIINSYIFNDYPFFSLKIIFCMVILCLYYYIIKHTYNRLPLLYGKRKD